jgi:hypothetical protein
MITTGLTARAAVATDARSVDALGMVDIVAVQYERIGG